MILFTRPSRLWLRLLLAVIAAAQLAACGTECDSCDTDEDCDSGQTCATFCRGDDCEGKCAEDDTEECPD